MENFCVFIQIPTEGNFNEDCVNDFLEEADMTWGEWNVLPKDERIKLLLNYILAPSGTEIIKLTSISSN